VPTDAQEDPGTKVVDGREWRAYLTAGLPQLSLFQGVESQLRRVVPTLNTRHRSALGWSA
jgi:hypothetical protein